MPVKGRDTMGVKFVVSGPGDAIVAIARNAEADNGTTTDTEAPEDTETTDSDT